METKKCIGCGAILQSDDETKAGYIPKDKYIDSNYCKRCFRLIHYNEQNITTLNKSNEDIIKEINKNDGYVFFLIDFLNINKEVIETFKSIKLKKSLLISKCDLIPNSLSKDSFINNIKKVYDIDDDITLISSNKKYNLNFIDKVNDYKRIYIMGYSNAGKSTLINTLLGENKITTSYSVNTTLDMIELKYKDYIIIDTPGLILSKTFYDINDTNLMKRINTKYFVRPISYQVKIGQIFRIENKIELSDFSYNKIIFYMSNLLSIKKLYKLNDDEVVELSIPSNSDLVIYSLGFINIKKECKLKINKDYVHLIELRPSIIGGSYE